MRWPCIAAAGFSRSCTSAVGTDEAGSVTTASRGCTDFSMFRPAFTLLPQMITEGDKLGQGLGAWQTY